MARSKHRSEQPVGSWYSRLAKVEIRKLRGGPGAQPSMASASPSPHSMVGGAQRGDWRRPTPAEADESMLVGQPETILSTRIYRWPTVRKTWGQVPAAQDVQMVVRMLLLTDAPTPTSSGAVSHRPLLTPMVKLEPSPRLLRTSTQDEAAELPRLAMQANTSCRTDWRLLIWRSLDNRHMAEKHKCIYSTINTK